MAEMTETDDEWARLLDAANRGDSAAYAAFLRAATPVLRGIVRARARMLDTHMQEDIVQDVLLAIHLKRGTWQPDRPPRPWLYAIARHKIVDALRKRGREPLAELLDETPDTIAAPTEADVFATRDVARNLDALDTRSGGILRALAFEGLGMAEVAKRFALSDGAARVALHRALNKLAALRERENG
ncbi:MAG: sigma-70 family RNA polymerase sigma factor [Paracoccaceae bacterium]